MAVNYELKANVTQFKTAMRDAQASVKTLNTELKLNSAQLKSGGDKEKLMAERTALLQKQIKEQEKAVKAAQSALQAMTDSGTDPASAAYQRMQESVAKAQLELVNMQQELQNGGKSFEDITDDANDFAENLDSINRNTKFTAVINGLHALKGVVQSVANGIKGIMSDVGASADRADDIITESLKYGVSTEELQRMRYAERFVDVSAETILRARNKLLNLESEGGILKIGDYGIASTADNLTDKLWDVLDAIGQIKDEVAQDSLAQEIFGKGYNELMPLIKYGREGYAELLESATIVNEENISKLGAIDDKLEELDAQWMTFKDTFTAEFADELATIIDSAISVVQSLNDFINAESTKNAIRDILSIVNGLLSLFGKNAAKVDTTDLSGFEKWMYGENGGNSVYTAMTGKNAEYYNASASTARELMERYGADVQYRYNAKTGEYIVDEEWLERAGKAMTESTVEGILDNAEAAYQAGSAIANQFTSGAAGSGGSPTNNYTSTYNVENMNINNALDAETMRNAVNAESARVNAGYGV